MRTIHKFPVKPEMFLAISDNAKPLCVQDQNGDPQMWVEVDTNDVPAVKTRNFVCYGTGHEMIEVEQKYVGTFQRPNSGLVFHVYEIV